MESLLSRALGLGIVLVRDAEEGDVALTVDDADIERVTRRQSIGLVSRYLVVCF